MNEKLQALTIDELVTLLNEERKKFIVAIDYGSTVSDLEEIRESIKELETIISSRQKNPGEVPAKTNDILKNG